MNNERQPLAIVGMACRFPKVDGIAELLQALNQGVNAIDTVPADRWDANRYFSSNEASKGKAYVRRGGFLKQNIQEFDAAFFGISPREAENMDPQQRLILEVVWEAFENAGFRLPEFSGANIGVYVGGFMLDHMITQMAFANRSKINQHSAAGMMMTMLSNRVSHTFNFVGPSMSIDTACSSSLVSFHVACQDVWRGACDMAVVGGSNVMMRPEYPMGMCKGHFLSRDGESKSFDRRGDGYGRGEGAGAILVKPYHQAKLDGDMILATVLGTGTNQDGRTPGISMPNGESQRSLIESVCQEHGIQFDDVDYVECHGTGTGIGDPTECTAIGNTYGKNRSDNPVVIGSIKSNIGHLEAAAGVAGIIKAVLTLQERRAFPLGNFQEHHKEIDFCKLGIKLSTEFIPLGNADEPIKAAVNSFGYGGSNAHVILGSAAPAEETSKEMDASAPQSPIGKSFLLPITAKSSKALKANAKQMAQFLEDSNSSVEDIVYSAVKHRAHLSHRAVVSGATTDELVTGLEAVASDSYNPNCVVESQPFQGIRKPVFVFTGMGPQWWYMGQQLYESEPLYRDVVEEADSIFKTISGFSILKEMLKSEAESRIHKTVYAQPANLVLQIGIYELLKNQGVSPGVVVGHSVGELASAYASGILTLADALNVSFHRSQLQAETAGTGGMLAVGLGKQEVLKRLSLDNGVSLAAINSTSTVTLAGEVSELEKISDELTSGETFNRMLDVEIPYHSPLMDPLMGRLKAALSNVVPTDPKLPVFSTVTGEQVTKASFGADYWPRNIRQPVEFEAAIMNILEQGYTTFVEIGPHPVLASSLRDCASAAGKDCRLIHTLRRNIPDESQSVLRAAMNVFAAGCEIDWDVHCPAGRFLALPNYAWQRETYWNENDRAAQDRINPIISPILGTQEALAAPVWRNDFDHEPVTYLRDHVVSGMPILPAAAYLEALFELSAIQFPEAKGFAVRDVDIQRPAIIAPERGLDFTTTYDPGTRSVVQRSLENGKLGTGIEHLSARISGITHCSPDSLDMDGVASESTADIDAFYSGLKQLGLSYGKQFQTVKRLIKAEDGSVLARLELSDDLKYDCDKYHLHPTLLDGCFQSLMSMLNTSDVMFLPTNIEEICFYQTKPESLEVIWCNGEMKKQSSRAITCDLSIRNDQGQLICSIRGLTATAAAKSEERIDKFGDPVKLQILNYNWDYGETLAEPSRLGHWLLVGQPPDPARFIGAQLENFGATICGDVSFGTEFHQQDNQFTVNHNSLDDAKEVVSSVGQLDGIVFFVALDEQLTDVCSTGQNALEALITFTKAMLDTPVSERPRIYVVTRGCFDIEGEACNPNPKSAAVNGWVRVARNELAGFQFSTVDISNCEDEIELFWVSLELVSDSPHDEVAIRGEMRFVSELSETKLLSEDRVQNAGLNDESPVLIRPLKADSDSVGTVRVVADSKNSASDDEIVIRVDKSAVPASLLKNQSSSEIAQPLVEFVGHVIEVGSDVHDLALGDEVCGLAPSEIASHLSGIRNDFFLTEVPEEIDRANLLANIGILAKIHYACGQHKNLEGKRAIVTHSPHTDLLVEHLSHQGVNVTVMLESEAVGEDTPQSEYGVCLPCPEKLAAMTHSDGKFDLLVADLAAWAVEYGFSCLNESAGVLDTSVQARPAMLPAKIRTVSRMDLNYAIAEPSKLKAAVESAVQTISTNKRYPRVAFEVSIADLSWRKLPLNDTDTFLVVSYDIGTRDLPVVHVDDLKFKSDATYLITGGLGGFGKKTAFWLADHGAGCIALIGRKGIKTAEDQKFVEQLEKAGVKVAVFACDVGNPRQVQALFNEIAETLPPLKGVFHSAAVIQDQPIAETELSTFKTVMDAKALGAWNLHLASIELKLDHFVLYSSLSNQIGNSRQGAYSAANGFLNGLARLRKSMDMPAISVNWGAISDVGIIAQDEKLEAFLRQVGLRGLSSGEGLELLRKALARDVNQFGVVVIKSWADWARYETEGSKSPRFATVIAADSDDCGNEARQQLLAELAMLTPAAQVDLMGNLIAQIVASVLKSEPDSLEINRPINELGIDSLMATEIQILFEKNLGISIAVLELLGDTTIRSMASGLVEKMSEEMLQIGQDDSENAASMDEQPNRSTVDA